MIAQVLPPGITARVGTQLGSGWVHVQDVDKDYKLNPSSFSPKVLSGDTSAIVAGTYVLVDRVNSTCDEYGYMIWGTIGV